MFPIFAGSNPSGYNLTRSLRFRSSASAYLSRTPASASNRQIFTFSGWVKRGTLGARQGIIVCTDAPVNNYFDIEFIAADQLDIQGSNGTWRLATSAVYRDPSAWYHIVLAVDTTQATASNRVKLYVNGSQVTAFSTASYPTLNSNCYFNLNAAHSIGSWQPASGLYFDGYLTEVNFIDGQALTPSSFGSTNTLTGVWQPAAYTGSYGTNGFELQFTDNSAATAAAIGKDSSGNGNNWTPNNISVTAGVTYDSMTDVPTLTSATAANFCVMNPLDKNTNITVSGGNLNAISDATTNWRSGAMTFGNFTTGKWYYEVTANSIGAATYISAGWELTSFNHTTQTSGVGAASGNNFGVLINTALRQTKVNAAGFSSDVNVNANGDVLIIAVDFDAGKGWVGKNGTWYDSGNPSAGTNPCTTTVSGGMTPAYQAYNAGSLSFNAGQRPFTYTPPTGFVALNTYNLPTSTIVNGAKEMGILLYTGDGTTSKDVTGLSFQPDLTYVKNRSAASDPTFSDTLRGITKVLYTDSTSAESTAPSFGYINSILSTGFNVNSGGGTEANFNKSGQNYVGWTWKAGQGSSSSNTNGSITSTISLNASAGLSMVTYTGTGANATVGHGLGVAPSLIIGKSRSFSQVWVVGHTSLGWGNYLLLNTTDASAAAANVWNSTAPTSSVFSLGTGTGLNSSGATYVAYCWTPIAGYSAFGSYSGSGSTDGPFIYTNFQPKFVLIKASSTTSQWVLWDAARNTYNVTNSILYPNLNSAEASFSIDILSNGFKFREAGGAGNDSGVTYIYAAFATSPFKNSLAR